MHALSASPNVVMRLVQLIIYSAGIFSDIRWLRIAYSYRNLSLEQIFFVTQHVYISRHSSKSYLALFLSFSSYAQCGANSIFFIDKILKTYRKIV